MNIINIAKEYSDTPLGRYPEDGDFNGTRFRDDFLLPALRKGETAVVIDGVEGYGSSFLEEAFGGLVRKGYFTAEELQKKLNVQFEERGFEMYRNMIWRYIGDAKPEKISE